MSDNLTMPVLTPEEGDLVVMVSTTSPKALLPLGPGIIVKSSNDIFPGIWWWILIDSNIIKVHVGCLKIIDDFGET